MVKIGIHIFRKDLRLTDNLALIELSKCVDKIIPIFILDKRQIEKNDVNKFYFSNSSVQFICESLVDLNIQCNNNLNLFFGDPVIIIDYLCSQLIIDYISFNADYTKYSEIRDSAMLKLCDKHKIIPIVNYDDQCLSEMLSMVKVDGSPYMVFGAFLKNAKRQEVLKPQEFNKHKLSTFVKTYKYKFNISSLQTLYDVNNELSQRGGRKEGLLKLNNKVAATNFYNRDLLINKTFNISAYLNFGCISIREFYAKYQSSPLLINQLYWRDFYLCILRYHPNGSNYNFLDDRFNLIKWKSNKKDWTSLMNCSTGFLLIDAAMRELQTTGYIGNRARLLLGTFWCKYLLINPFHKEYGSQVGFSKYLVDCSVSQNKLNHSWLISELDLTGRRFAKKKMSPLTGRIIRFDNDMIKKYDPSTEYIKKWLPEYKDFSFKEMRKVKTIFDWEIRYLEYCKLFD